MNKQNYQKELDTLLAGIRKKETDFMQDGERLSDSDSDHKTGSAWKPPRLFLHSCCAPCSSYVLEYLSEYFEICDFFYNPNIEPETEYRHREEELQRLISEMKPRYPISFVSGEYDPKQFYDAVRGLEHIHEGGERCFACYRLRMEEAARLASEGGYDFFTTTLSISPLKRADKINEIGQELELKYKVKHLPSDFKKKGGYQRSITLSKEHGLYRQDYCGCVFSRTEREKQKAMKADQ